MSQEEVKSCSDLSMDRWPELTLSWKLADAAKPTRESPPGDLPNPGNKPTSLTSFASAGGYFTTWRRQWQPTLVFLLGEFHGQRSLAGYSPWGRKESDMTSNCHSLPLAPPRKPHSLGDTQVKDVYNWQMEGEFAL